MIEQVIFNLVINSLLSWVTVCVCVCLLLKGLSKSSHRARVFLLLIPIGKLLVDPLLYNWSNWVVSVQGCEPGSRMFTMAVGYSYYPWALLCFSTQEGLSFSVGDILFSSLPYWLSCVLAYGTFGIIALRIGAYFSRFIRLRKELSRVLQQATPAKGYWVSHEISTPCCTGIFRQKVILPHAVAAHASPDEIEAILAHERAHLRWQDPLVNAAIELIQAIYFWLPIGWWKRSIELEQEHACDRAYPKDPLLMAQAIVRSAKNGFSYGCALNTPPLVVRIEALTQQPPPKSRRWVITLLTTLGLILLVSRFWIL